MISRRPNTRASSENAPGPSKTMATKMVTAKTIAGLESNSVGVEAGSRESLTAIAPKPTAAPAIGVRKPISKRAPDTRAAAPASHVAGAPPVSRK